MSFPSTFDLILKFAVALGQSFGDDICATGHIKRALKKYCVTDFEFVLGHDDTHHREVLMMVVCPYFPSKMLFLSRKRNAPLRPPKKSSDSKAAGRGCGQRLCFRPPYVPHEEATQHVWAVGRYIHGPTKED